MQRSVIPFDRGGVCGGRLFQDDMGVGAAEAERADAGTPRTIACESDGFPSSTTATGRFAQSMKGFGFLKFRCWESLRAATPARP